MKLLLTSNGLSNDSIARALVRLNGKPARKSKVAFIPTAANPEPGAKGWLIDDLARIQARGYEVDVVDIAALPKKLWLPRLRSADILFFGGGNSYYLLDWVRQSGLEKELPSLLKRRVYAGISAGGIVSGPDLKVSSLKFYYPEDIGRDTPALDLVDFYMRPHFGSPHFPKMRLKYLKPRFSSFKKPVYVIDDMTAIAVDGKKVNVVSEGKHVILGGTA
ncbi:hypothetical protein EXS54_00275 [Patescibacteria group bacterium]|nr:hypothetical protein [Patescibacteria group bacterium]